MIELYLPPTNENGDMRYERRLHATNLYTLEAIPNLTHKMPEYDTSLSLLVQFIILYIAMVATYVLMGKIYVAIRRCRSWTPT